MPRAKFRSLRRSVLRGKRSRKPKEEPGSSADVPSAKKIRLDESASPVTSKEVLSNKKPSGYHFQARDVSILRKALVPCAVCKECLKGNLQLFERPSGCGLGRMLVLQCANNSCRALTELPTSEKIVHGEARFFDINRRSALVMRIIGRGRASLTKFCAVMNMPGPVAKKSFTTYVKAITRVSQQVANGKRTRRMEQALSSPKMLPRQ